MSERKNIDKLFQEKFKDFEVEPAEEVWSGIEAKLKEKKKDRKVIPFWWKLSGVAAALLLGFMLTDGYLNRDVVIQNNSVVDGDTNNNSNKNNTVNPAGNASKNDNAIVNTENPAVIKENSGNQNANINPVENSNSATANNRTDVIKSKTESNTQLVVNENNNSGKAHKKAKRNHSGGISNASDSNNFSTEENRLAQNSSNKKSKGTRGIVEPGGTKSNRSANPSLQKNDELQNDIQNQKQTDMNNKSYINESNPVADSQNKTNSKPDSSTAKTISPDNHANPMVTAENKKLDSTAIATVVPNALEELLNEKENNLVTKEPHVNRWQITSSVAPIYFGSTSKGSPIDSTFAGNSKDYKTNVSVNLGVNYVINKKFSIRTGISQVTFNYNTNDVYISAGMQGGPLKNVTTSPESQFLNFGKRPSGNNLTAGDPELLSTDTFQSYINQKMGYIEVPLELTYSLYDRRFGINIIGGVSTLFLNENKIVVVSEGMKSTLGEANNLNKTHFSSNIGLGVKYRIYKDFQANFEPMFKYQINTFSKDDGNFKPYYFGLYTGLSYSF